MAISDPRFNKYCSLEIDVLTIKHNSGFFSNCSIALYGIIQYVNYYKKLPRLVDFSETFQNFCSVQTKNPYEQFFLAKANSEFVFQSDEKIAFNALSIFDYRQESFAQIAPFVQHYFSPSLEVMKKVDMLMEKWHVQPKKTIAVCYRGTDKFRDTGLASYADFITKAKTFQQKHPEYHILIQTDQAQFWHAATAELKNVYRFSETPFTTSNTVMHEIIDEADKIEWTQWFMAATIVISRCAFIVNHSGNVARWICLYRQNANNMSQYMNQKKVTGSELANQTEFWLS